jgi:hypothetical protein
MSTVSITWRDANSDKPDSDITVLCWDGETPFFTGYWDSATEQWIDCATGAAVFYPTHWAEPEGPAA